MPKGLSWKDQMNQYTPFHVLTVCAAWTEQHIRNRCMLDSIGT
jgi:hypothetical protein